MGIQINGQTDTVTSTTSGGTVKITPASINATGVSTFSDIRITGGTIAGVSTAGITTAYIGSVNDGPIAGTRNRVINGDMRIDQRNAGASVTSNGATYTLDRWQAYSDVGSKYSVQQVSDAPTGFTNSIRATSSSAYTVGTNEVFGLFQYIEGFNVADLGFGAAGATTVTLSFWVKSSLTGTFGGALLNNGFTRAYPFTYSIAAANTWEQKTLTIAGDATGTWLKTNGVGLGVILGLGCGSGRSATAGAWTATNLVFSATGATSVVATSGATFYITGIQLEPGSTATPFERRSYGQELAMCQRYYQQIGKTASSNDPFAIGFTIANAFHGAGFLKTTMRSAPTLSYTGNIGDLNYTHPGVAATVNSIAASITNADSFYISLGSATGTTTGYGAYARIVTSSTALTFTSEL